MPKSLAGTCVETYVLKRGLKNLQQRQYSRDDSDEDFESGYRKKHPDIETLFW